MSTIPPLSTDLEKEIESLSDDLDAVLTKHPRRPVPQFDERRRALLAKHLGHEPPADIEPVTCVGDSNTMFFAGAERVRFIRYRRSALLKPYWINRGLDLLPCFRTFHIGPSTAWKAGDHGSSTRSREKLEILLRKDVPPGSKLLISIGEIDCRIHMAKQAVNGKDIAKLVETTAAKYVKLPAWVQSQGFKPLVWAPPQIVPKDEVLSSPTFPFIGSWELRRDITYAYIERLKHHCGELGIPVIALAGKYHPPEVKADLSNFHDGVHLSQRLMPLALRELAATGFLPEGCRP